VHVQVQTLNAAFRAASLRFRLDGVVAVPATDAALLNCSASWEQLAQQLLTGSGMAGTNASSSSNSSSTGDAAPGLPAVHVIVCEPDGAQGASSLLEGTLPSNATFGAVLLRRSALWLSRTSLVHQVCVPGVALPSCSTLPGPDRASRQLCWTRSECTCPDAGCCTRPWL
jgi:hypothetical protein